ncbi:MAG TPA: sulfur carrier protein ThiS [Candidatus Methanoperedens sp.]|nr:sulfur carrier protein ThiS [Candidatus Methanoperedens sp.]
MRVIVNGAPREVAEGTSASDLLAALNLAQAPVVVERNGEIVRRADQPGTLLLEEDRLVIVRLVAGG